MVAIGALVSVSGLADVSAGAQTRAKSPATSCVALRCKIVGSSEDAARDLWFQVELRSAADELLRQTRRLVGGTVRFKDLASGIYRVCLLAKGRRKCESVDLTPAPDQELAEFTKELRVPDGAVPEPGPPVVDVRALAVPREALRELQQSNSDQTAGDEEAAVRHLKRAIEIYPDYAEALNNLGAFYYRKGEYEQATRAFLRVTELDPRFAVGWRNLGNCMLASGKFDKAAQANGRAVSLDPEDVVAVSQLGLSYYYLRNYQEAKKYFKRVYDLDPAFGDSPQLYLAHIAMGERSFDEALEYFRNFLQYHPNSPRAPAVRETLKAFAEGRVYTAPAKKSKKLLQSLFN